MVYRVFVEKKKGLDNEAKGLLNEARTLLGMERLENVRLFNRYDAENITEDLFRYAVKTVFSEPQLDTASASIQLPGAYVFAVEALPGQFDQRADSAAQCIQIISQGERPLIRTAKVYALYGALTDGDIREFKKYVINPVECREASLDVPETLAIRYDIPTEVATLTGFTGLSRDELADFIANYGLAMDLDDIAFCQSYFQKEDRDPTITEIRMIDTYWSDHCRHTTFGTILDHVTFEDALLQKTYEDYLTTRNALGRSEKPICLMDLATIAVKHLKAAGKLPKLDESEEINACTVKMDVTVDGVTEPWLLLFKNETHNHPTEIEPFGGAATCIGGCIRDPLSGRAYVHQAMRLTGCGDPRTPVAETLSGKLPQRKLAQTAAAGYSSYGNQIGLATGLVSEVYHPGYIAKHLECGVVVAAAPAENVVRERPQPGDVVILLGGRTGRDGIGGATGSSKSHNRQSLTTMASEVQKGNAPEERKIQRLFRDGNVTRLIKRCNDFGAGGVSVAAGELADGLDIDLDAVRKKYDGLDGTELAISESQERMAVVVARSNADRFIAAAEAENLEAYPVAVVTASPRMVMRWRGRTIVDLSRDFLNTNGAVKHARAAVPAPIPASPVSQDAENSSLRSIASSLASAFRRGLAERFDSTIGCGSVLMPFGGRNQRTPAQVMAALLPVLPGQETDQASVMAWGFDPEAMAVDPYRGAYNGVVTSLAKLVAAGADYRRAYLTLQEFFEKLREDPARWGKPFAALLGALDAQLDFGAAAIGGKDSMSGTFNDLDVPPTLISFAIAPIRAGEVLSPEFKEAGHPVYLFAPANGGAQSQREAWETFHQLCRAGRVCSAWAVEHGIAEGIMQMSFGNSIGFQAEGREIAWDLPCPGAIVAELTEDTDLLCAVRLGTTTAEPVLTTGADSVSIDELLSLNESVLEDVYPSRVPADPAPVPVLEAPAFSRAAPRTGTAKPKVLIPVFPGTNCEYDSARAALRAGLEPQILVLNNQTPDHVAASAARFAQAARSSQILFLPGGFSGGDEPDGSGKFITAFLRSPQAADAVMDLLQNRDGLVLGICNGFQALIKLGLVPFGEIRDTDAACPTLTYNVIGRHQSRIVRTRVASNRSPWLTKVQVGDIVSVPISHGEGRFLCPPDLLAQLAENGQIATQYVDLDGHPTMDIDGNPNGSVWSVEGITSPDGRVFGKMGHAERVGPCLYRNIPGNYDLGLFDAAKDYFSL